MIRLRKVLFVALLCCAQFVMADRLTVSRQSITIDFGESVAHAKGVYTIKRSVGRFGPREVVGRTRKSSWTDRKVSNPRQMYYWVENESGEQVSVLAYDIELFGLDVRIYRPTDNMDSIHNEVIRVHEELFRTDFSSKRYAELFQPGDYRAAGLLKVPFYVHLAGLGRTPYEVQINNVHTPPHLANGNGTCTFWRSMENMSVIGPETYDEEETFKWSVSQAAPLRRVYAERTTRHQWGKGWVSGGFTADCYFAAPVGSDHQQQWYTRNSFLEKGRGIFKEMKYNYVFQGVELGKDADASTYVNNWDKGGNVTFLPTIPVIREKPFLFVDENGRYKVFRPALRRNSSGVSYTRTFMGQGETLDLEREFFIAHPGVTARTLNEALRSGKHLLFVPGMYEMEEPLHVTRPNTIVMGLGWTTLIPGEKNSDTAIRVDDVDGVTIASILFDAHYSSHTLVTLAQGGKRHVDNPTLLADLFFRVGGFRPAPVHVDCAIEIGSNDVIGDHFWIWRADHGVKKSVGWEVNTAPVGLHVVGDEVTMYALFNEHFQGYQTLWEGDGGRTYFYQCESPYDAREQQRYMSEDGKRCGFAAYKVAEHVNRHEAVGFGIYDVLFQTNIRIENSVEVPEKPGIRLYHICNNSLSAVGPRGIGFIYNGKVKSTYNTWRDNRTYIDEVKF